MGTAYYWNKTGADANWATFTGNWFYDAAHTSQATEVPVANADVYLDGTTAPATGPAAITFDRFDTSGLNVNLTATAVTSPITIAASGVLVIGSATYSTRTHTWAGTATAASITYTFQGKGGIGTGGSAGNSVTFNGTGTCIGTVGTNCIFNNSFVIATGAVIGNGPTLNNSASITGGTTGTGLTCNDTSIVRGGTVGDGYVFAGGSFFDSGGGNLTLGTSAGGTWNSTGRCSFSGGSGLAVVTLFGPMLLLKPLILFAGGASTGNIVIPRREWDIPLGTSGSKIIVGQAYGYQVKP